MKLYQSMIYREDLETTIGQIVDVDKLFGSTVLITGATGTIGSFLVDVLLELNMIHQAKIHVIAAGRDVKRLKTRFSWAKDDCLTCVFYDMRQPIAFQYTVDYVIHAAGNATPTAFNGDPVGTIMGNVQGTYALLEYGRAYGMKRFLYVSSGEVYGLSNENVDLLSEEYSGPVETMSPRSCYPSSKRAAETLCASYAAQYGTQVVIVRPCHTYGANMTEADSRAHAQFFRNAMKRQNIVLKSAGSQMRSYSYVADCVSGLLTVLLCGKNANAYNLANPNARATIAQLAGEIARAVETKVVFEVPSETEISNRSPIVRQVLASDKLEALGWKGAYDTRRGVERTLAILKSL